MRLFKGKLKHSFTGTTQSGSGEVLSKNPICQMFNVFIEFFLLVITCFLGCNSKKQVPIGDFITIQMVDSIKGNLNDSHLALSYFVDKIDIIPLEFTDDCILSQIGKVVIHEDNIFIIEPFERRTCTVYRFDLKGNFLNSIGARGQGPLELLELRDFSINENNNSIYLLDNAKKTVFHFDFNGILIEKININQGASRLEFKNGFLYLYRDNPPASAEHLYNLIIRNTKGELVKMYIPSNTEYLISGERKIFTKTNDGLFFKQAMDDTIYYLDRDSLKYHIFFDFGSYRFTQEEIEDIYMMRQKAFNILLQNERLSIIDHFYQIGNWYYFNAIYKIMSHSFLYNKKCGDIKVASRLYDDLEYMFYDNKFYGQTQDAFIGIYFPETKLERDMTRFSRYEKEGYISTAFKEKQLTKINSIMRGDKPENMNPWILLYYLKKE